jgi:hypothetical protein
MAIGSGGWRRLLRVWDRARVRRAGRETRGRGVSRGWPRGRRGERPDDEKKDVPKEPGGPRRQLR